MLLAVDGPQNESKGDDDASGWLPPRAAFDCPYVERQIAIKTKYRLWVTASRAPSDGDRARPLLGTSGLRVGDPFVRMAVAGRPRGSLRPVLGGLFGRAGAEAAQPERELRAGLRPAEEVALRDVAAESP